MKKALQSKRDLQVAIILTADWMQQFEDCVTETSIRSQSGWHYICFVT